MNKSISVTFLLFSLGTLRAIAEPATGTLGTPDKDDLRLYVFCSDLAAERPLSFNEAAACETAYDRVKLAFVPGVSPEDFMALPTRDRAAVNLVGYDRFRDWFDANPEAIEALREELRADPAPAGG